MNVTTPLSSQQKVHSSSAMVWERAAIVQSHCCVDLTATSRWLCRQPITISVSLCLQHTQPVCRQAISIQRLVQLSTANEPIFCDYSAYGSNSTAHCNADQRNLRLENECGLLSSSEELHQRFGRSYRLDLLGRILKKRKAIPVTGSEAYRAVRC
jgi:hypothetical protein